MNFRKICKKAKKSWKKDLLSQNVYVKVYVCEGFLAV